MKKYILILLLSIITVVTGSIVFITIRNSNDTQNYWGNKFYSDNIWLPQYNTNVSNLITTVVYSGEVQNYEKQDNLIILNMKDSDGSSDSEVIRVKLPNVIATDGYIDKEDGVYTLKYFENNFDISILNNSRISISVSTEYKDGNKVSYISALTFL